MLERAEASYDDLYNCRCEKRSTRIRNLIPGISPTNGIQSRCVMHYSVRRRRESGLCGFTKQARGFRAAFTSRETNRDLLKQAWWDSDHFRPRTYTTPLHLRQHLVVRKIVDVDCLVSFLTLPIYFTGTAFSPLPVGALRRMR
eukprot:764089-Hanusia_phi.AAC.3